MLQLKAFVGKFKAIGLTIFFATVAFAANEKGANLKFEKQQIVLGSKTITVEIADSPEKLSQGLMDRHNMPEDAGMLFVFSDEQIRNFWMKNTYIPLAIGFFNKEKVLVDTQEMTPVKSSIEIPKTYQSKLPAQYVLEMNTGWFKKNKIPLKSKFSFVEKSKP